jgi:hypothetical protein
VICGSGNVPQELKVGKAVHLHDPAEDGRLQPGHPLTAVDPGGEHGRPERDGGELSGGVFRRSRVREINQGVLVRLAGHGRTAAPDGNYRVTGLAEQAREHRRSDCSGSAGQQDARALSHRC